MLLTEHQRSRHPLWQTILLVAYEPMLRSISRRTRGARRDDAGQGALRAFLEAIAKVRLDPPPALLSLTLRHATERGAFAESTFHEEAPTEPLAKARSVPDPHDQQETLEREDQMRAVVRELLALFGDEGEAREVLEVLLVARTGRPALLDYIDETYPRLTPAKRAAVYARLQRMRDRALAHLTKVFGGASDDAEHEAFAA